MPSKKENISSTSSSSDHNDFESISSSTSILSARRTLKEKQTRRFSESNSSQSTIPCDNRTYYNNSSNSYYHDHNNTNDDDDGNGAIYSMSLSAVMEVNTPPPPTPTPPPVVSSNPYNVINPRFQVLDSQQLYQQYHHQHMQQQEEQHIQQQQQQQQQHISHFGPKYIVQGMNNFDTSPAVQPQYIHNHEYITAQQQQQQQQIFVKPLPSVNQVVQEIWKIDFAHIQNHHNHQHEQYSDIYAMSRLIKLLLQSLRNHDNHEITPLSTTSTSTSFNHTHSGGDENTIKANRYNYDPTEVFLCIQNFAHRFNDVWITLNEKNVERIQERRRRGKKNKMVDVSVGNSSSYGDDGNSSSRSSNNRSKSASSTTSIGHDLKAEDDEQVKSTTGKHDQSYTMQAKINKKCDDDDDDLSIEKFGYFDTNLDKNNLSYDDDNHDDDDDDDNNNCDEDTINIELWNDQEQISWDIWENIMWSVALLAKLCIGPSWKIQTAMRWELFQSAPSSNSTSTTYNSNSERDVLSRSNKAWEAADLKEYQNYDEFSGSKQNSQSAQSDGAFSSSKYLRNDDPWNDFAYPHIPEVLPVSLLRFAASFGNTLFPSFHKADSVVKLESKDADLKNHDNVNISTYYYNSITQLVWDEQRWIMRMQRICEAQRELVYALCCSDNDFDEMSIDESLTDSDSDHVSRNKSSHFSDSIHSNKSSEHLGRNITFWNIPNAHVPIANMMSKWVEIAQVRWPSQLNDAEIEATLSSHIVSNEHTTVTNSVPCTVDISWGVIVNCGAIDWIYCLEVCRIFSDLIAAGWSPPPSGSAVEGSIEGLTSILQQGVFMSPSDMKFSRNETHQEARQERLAATSCTAEVMSAFNDLGSRSLIPLGCTRFMSKSLCRILASTDLSVVDGSETDLYPIDGLQNTNEYDAALHERDTFLSQKETCMGNGAELLWVLLANEVYITQTVDALLQIIDVTSPPCMSSFTASGGIRALGAAMWGDPPIKGIPSLRILWGVFLKRLSNISISLFNNIECSFSPVENKQPNRNQHSLHVLKVKDESHLLIESYQSVPPLESISCYNFSSLTMVLEIAIAIRRLVDGEMNGDHDTLCVDEWDSFISILEKGLLPWLAYSYFDDQVNYFEDGALKTLFRKVANEVKIIFQQVMTFLTRESDISPILNTILDTASCARLHFLFFRMVTPYLSPEESEICSKLIIKSWLRGRGVFQNVKHWCKKASYLLRETFAIYDHTEASGANTHVHGLKIQLEAVQYLVNIDLKEMRSVWENQHSLSTISVSDQVLKHVLGMHLDSVCDILLPYLVDVLLQSQNCDYLVLPVIKSPIANKNLKVHASLSDENMDTSYLSHTKYLLNMLQIIGGLLYGGNLEKRNVNLIIATLRSFLLDDSSFLYKDKVSNETFMTAKDHLHLKIEAVHQLHICLQSLFTTIPLCRDLLENILIILCEVAEKYCTSCNCTNSFEAPCIRVLSVVSLIPLLRLCVTHNQKIAFLGRKGFSERLSSVHTLKMQLLQDFINRTFDNLDSCNNVEAPLLFFGKKSTVNYSHDSLDSKIRLSHKKHRYEESYVDLNLIYSTVYKIHSQLDCNKTQVECKISTQIKSLCFNLMTKFSLSGFFAETPSLIRESHEGSGIYSLENVKDVLSSNYSTSVIEDTEIGLSVSNLKSLPEFTKLLHLHESVTSVACQKVSVLIASNFATALNECMSSEQQAGMKDGQWIKECSIFLLQKVRNVVDEIVAANVTNVENIKDACDSLVPVLSLLYDIFSFYKCFGIRPSQECLEKMVKLCLQVFSSESVTETISCQVRLLITLCAAIAVSLMNVEDIVLIKENHDDSSRSKDEDFNISSSIIFDLLSNESSRLDTNYLLTSTPNERLAKEYENVENFVTDSTHPNGALAYVYGHTLLTLNRGSPNSRYRNFIQIIRRSPTSHSRKLIKIPDQIALSNPDFPSSMWDRLLDDSKKEPVKVFPRTFEGVHTCDNSVIFTAKSVIERFENVNPRPGSIFSPRAMNSLHYRRRRSLSDIPRDFYKSRSTDDVYSNITHTLDDLALHPQEKTVSNEVKERFPMMKNTWSDIKQVDQVENEISSLVFGSKNPCSDEKVRRLNFSPKLKRAIAVLDRTSSLQTHKIALLYKGAASFIDEELSKKIGTDTQSTNRDTFLDVKYSSPIFSKFCNALGTLVPTPTLKHFSGGLDTSIYRADGLFALVWIDGNERYLKNNIMCVFHDVPLMPPGINNRKRHVGNDVVQIVFTEDPGDIFYDDSARDEDMESELKSEFGFVTIYVIPIGELSEKVKIIVKIKKDLDEEMESSLRHLKQVCIMPFVSAPAYVRQLAIRADLACRSVMQDRLGLYSNWEDRLKQITDMERFIDS